jgi:signal transduction histidine kinase
VATASSTVVGMRRAHRYLDVTSMLVAPTPRTAALLDVGLALAVAAIGLPSAVDATPHHGPLGLLLTFGLAVPLVWRRRWPLSVFAAVAAVAFCQWLSAERLAADVALLVAFYSVAISEDARETVAAAVVLEVGAVFATERWGAEHARFLVFVLLSGMTTAAFFLGATLRIRREYLASVEDRAARLELERDQQAQIAVAAERARIARDMHDIVAHNLSVMIALADGAALTAGSDPVRANTAMQQVSATGRQALTEMRRLLGVLRADHTAAMTPQPGLDDIDALLAQVRVVGLRGELVTEGRPPLLAAGFQLTVYRLVQESLTNTLKHAVRATRSTVSLHFESGRLDVDVTDDGVAPTAAVSTQLGHGITGMRERAAVYGGTVEVGPSGSEGWRVHAHFDVGASELAS